MRSGVVVGETRRHVSSTGGRNNGDDITSDNLQMTGKDLRSQLLGHEVPADASSLLPPHLRKGQDVSQRSKRVVPKPTTSMLLVDDDDDAARSIAPAAASLAAVQEFELVDDAFTYFPLIDAHGQPFHSEGEGALPQPNEDRYTPGQQVIDPGHTRYRVDVQYMGSDFDGWYKSTEKRQRTPDGVVATAAADGDMLYAAERKHRAKTVLEDALAVALDVEQVKVEAGVIPEVGCSVRRLTCHVDIPDTNPLQSRTVMQRATSWLEKKQAPLAILSFHPCRNQQFHARHSGTKRVYVYRILNRIAPPLFDAGFQWHIDRHLDTDRMQRFADRLQGTMDYGYFADAKMAHALRREAHRNENSTAQLVRGRGGDLHQEAGASSGSSGPQMALNATVRTVETLRVVRQDDEVLIWFAGKSFLRHQIRNMVSVLRLAGQGLWSEQELDQALARGFTSSRTKAERERPATAPVHGLTLWSVEYPEQHSDSYVPYVDSGPLPQGGEDIRVVKTF